MLRELDLLVFFVRFCMNLITLMTCSVVTCCYKKYSIPVIFYVFAFVPVNTPGLWAKLSILPISDSWDAREIVGLYSIYSAIYSESDV